MLNVFEYVKAPKFLPDYCNIPYSSWTRQKWNKKFSGTFTEEEKKKIVAGLKKLVRDIEQNGIEQV